MWKLIHVLLFSTYLFLCVWLASSQGWKGGFIKLSAVSVSEFYAPLKSLPGTTWINFTSFLYPKKLSCIVSVSLPWHNKRAQGDELICEDWYRRCLKLSQLNCPRFQNFALPCPSMEGLPESLEQLSDGVETSTGEFFRWSYKMCDCNWNQSVIDQPADGFFTHTGGVNLVLDFLFACFTEQQLLWTQGNIPKL